MTTTRTRTTRDVGVDRQFLDRDPPRRGENSAEPPPEALRWVAGHCRFVATNLPRGELGVKFAAQLLAAVPEACRRRVPDLTETGPELVARCRDFGLLGEVPTARVVRAGLRLLADRSPILETRGKRHWTLWLVHLLDPVMLATIQKCTPASQLEVCGPSPAAKAQPREAVADEWSESDELRARIEQITRERDDKSAALDQVLLEAAALAEEKGNWAADRGRIRALEQTIEELRGEHKAELDQAKDLIARLHERLRLHEQPGEIGAALGSLLWKFYQNQKTRSGGEPEG